MKRIPLMHVSEGRYYYDSEYKKFKFISKGYFYYTYKTYDGRIVDARNFAYTFQYPNGRLVNYNYSYPPTIYTSFKFGR